MSHFLNRQRRSYGRSWLSNHTSRSIIFCYFISISFHTFVIYVRCRQNYAFFLKPPRKKQEIYKLSANYYKINCELLTVNDKLLFPMRFRAPEGGYILPFSRRVSVPCKGNRKGRKAYCGLIRMWSSPCRRDGEVEKSALRAVFLFFPKVSVPRKRGNRRGCKDH